MKLAPNPQLNERPKYAYSFTNQSNPVRLPHERSHGNPNPHSTSTKINEQRITSQSDNDQSFQLVESQTDSPQKQLLWILRFNGSGNYLANTLEEVSAAVGRVSLLPFDAVGAKFAGSTETSTDFQNMWPSLKEELVADPSNSFSSPRNQLASNREETTDFELVGKLPTFAEEADIGATTPIKVQMGS